MCGIAGLVGAGGAPQAAERRVLAMLDRLRPRGPDGSGIHRAPGVVLGSVRLAVVDPLGSQQPVRDATGETALVFNGEIYDYRRTARELSERGHVFRTDGDAEVILNLYLEHGDSFVERLDGMFALALWDGRRRRLVLARDRCGIKPLYVFRGRREILFASESKALLADANVPIGIDPAAVADYLDYRFIMPPRTGFVGIEKLAPGTMMCIEAGVSRTRAFWTPPLPAVRDGVPLPSVPDVVRSTLGDEKRAACLLSGGLDSSAVAAAGSRVADVHAYSAGYAPGSDEDETEQAIGLARKLGLAHRVVRIRSDHVLAELRAAIDALDEPIYTPVSISTRAVCAEAARTHRVALSGDGSDELFLGYAHFRTVRALVDRGQPWQAEYARALGWLRSEERGRVVVPDWPSAAAPWEARSDLADDPLEWVRRFEFRTKLPEYHLTRVDRLSMASGIEVRLPYLRNALVDWCLRRPARELIADVPEKATLRNAVAEALPADWLWRRKRKFTAPHLAWLHGARPGEVEDRLLSLDRTAVGLSRPGLEGLLRDFRAEAAGSADAVWGALVLASWHDVVGDRSERVRR